MGEGEEATVHTVTAYSEIIATVVQKHKGRVVDPPGDNMRAEFASVASSALGAGVKLDKGYKVIDLATWKERGNTHG